MSLTWGDLQALAAKIGATDDTAICVEHLRDEPDPHDPTSMHYIESAGGARAEVDADTVHAIIIFGPH